MSLRPEEVRGCNKHKTKTIQWKAKEIWSPAKDHVGCKKPWPQHHLVTEGLHDKEANETSEILFHLCDKVPQLTGEIFQPWNVAKDGLKIITEYDKTLQMETHNVSLFDRLNMFQSRLEALNSKPRKTTTSTSWKVEQVLRCQTDMMPTLNRIHLWTAGPDCIQSYVLEDFASKSAGVFRYIFNKILSQHRYNCHRPPWT